MRPTVFIKNVLVDSEGTLDFSSRENMINMTHVKFYAMFSRIETFQARPHYNTKVN